jgi:hypothetical protein
LPSNETALLLYQIIVSLSSTFLENKNMKASKAQLKHKKGKSREKNIIKN